jgi:hypothetical protein
MEGANGLLDLDMWKDLKMKPLIYFSCIDLGLIYFG